MNNQYRIDKIFQIYKLYGYLNIGEPMSQTEHALYSYYHMQGLCPNKSLHLSALLHDIGHYISYDKKHKLFQIHSPDETLDIDDKHEYTGSLFLEKLGFPSRVFMPIKHHVNAKRYLSNKELLHYSSLTNASKMTLSLQGGRMSNEEMLKFQKNRYFNDSILLRKADDGSKLYLQFHKESNILPIFKEVLTNNINNIIKN